MSTENPWKHRSSAVIYENPWMRLREDQVITPNGNPGIYAFIEKSAATGVIALTEDLQVVLVGQYRYPMKEYSWEIIEGGAEPQEAPIDAAKRELKEEAGLEARVWRSLGGEIHLSNCVTAERGHLFVAEELIDVGASPDVTEILQLRRVPLRDCVKLVESGEIKDSLSIIALLLLARERSV